MLSKSHRLTKKDIERLYKKGKVTPQDFILARTMLNKTNHSRFTVIIPKKVWPKASSRNRAKRIIYQWLTTHQNLWENQNLDIALLIKNQFEEKEINSALSKLFDKMK